MLSVARSPFTSPALRTVISASSRVSFPFESTASTAPCALVAGPGPRVQLLASPSTPQDLNPNRFNSSGFGGYFSLEVSSSPSHQDLQAPRSPLFLAPPQIAVHTPPVSMIQKALAGQAEEKPKPLDSGSTINRNISLTTEQPVEARRRRRPSFKLDIPRPNIVREDSFEAVALAGVVFTPGTPRGLQWSDSSDSVMTLKPTKGRVSTPYPRNEGEWMEDVNATRENVRIRLARLL